MRKILTIVTILIFSNQIKAQSSSPYEWSWKKDGTYLGVALGGTAAGFLLIQTKDGFTETKIQELNANIDDINFADRWVAGNYSESASTLSDIPFYTSFAMPALLFFDDETNDHSGQVLGMYLQTMATTGALFTISAGLTNRARPYVYNEGLEIGEKTESTATRSFYSGHVAATASATFFAAKVYQDFNPDSPAIPYLWAGAAAIPAAVGYLRLEAGQHFLTDIILGYVLGGTAGILVPELHKKSDNEFSINTVGGVDYVGNPYQGFSFQLQF